MVEGDFGLSLDELRAVAGYAVACVRPLLDRFEQDYPEDRRPRDAVAQAEAFARGGNRTKAIRDAAWAAMRAASDVDRPVAREIARAALLAASAAYLHPLARATQVKHILGAATHTARAMELDGDDPETGSASIEYFAGLADSTVRDVLSRYPRSPAGGGRVGELQRLLDEALRDI